ncbi:MAG TPA: hypothetical protein DCY13_15010 [Verrucomicrobiales bacterium]|nr:hypothetical protein [Verrucomicrobiales bacterium]
MFLFSLVTFTKLDEANQSLLQQLMDPLRSDMIDAGIPSNLVAAIVVGNPPAETELEPLTPYQQRKASKALIVFEEHQKLTGGIARSARTSTIVSLAFSLVLVAAGLLLLLRSRRKHPSHETELRSPPTQGA